MAVKPYSFWNAERKVLIGRACSTSEIFSSKSTRCRDSQIGIRGINCSTHIFDLVITIPSPVFAPKGHTE